MSAPCAMVVHLVHGTWPFGPFRRSSADKKAWFENGSAVRKSIESQVNCEVHFREFRWSGRNSFSARRTASTAFDNHLDKSLRESPETMHIIIAHSHGGTVAAEAIASRSLWMRGECRIKALVCLATPFAYLSPISGRDEFLFFSATGSIITALIAIAFIPGWIAAPEFNPSDCSRFGIPWPRFGFGTICLVQIFYSQRPAPSFRPSIHLFQYF